MKEFKIKQGTHVVLKVEDIEKYLNENQQGVLRSFAKTIEQGRLKDNKKLNDYYVVNTDEPYAPTVFETIINGEMKK